MESQPSSIQREVGLSNSGRGLPLLPGLAGTTLAIIAQKCGNVLPLLQEF